MLYRVVVDGTDILDHTDQTLVLLSPQAEIEIDVSGSFEFTLPPSHKYYDWFTADSIMLMTVEIYEDTTLHWFGRPIELHMDFYKNKKIYCEGALGYFNDSVIREAEYEDTALSTIFSAVIAEHNSMVPANRQFIVGNFTIPDHSVYRKFNYEQTSDVLKSKFLDAEEGHFFLRRENGTNYIDFLADMPYTCNQEVEFAENLLNFTYNFDGKDFATCVIPLGANDEETNKPITISSVNSNSDILVGNAAANYGKIVKVQHYSDIKDPSELVSEGRKYLTNLQFNAYLIECSAVDLHSKDSTEQLFRVGQKVTCVSNPHNINVVLPISKMTLYLDSAAKQITLGRIPKKTLARFYKERIASGDGSGIEESEPEIPAGWEIVPPDEDGGEPTLKRVPVMIDITHLPLQINYTDTDNDFDPTGIEVKLVAQGLPDLQYFTDEWYPSSVVPTSELRYEIGGMGIPTQSISAGGALPSKAQIMVWAIWKCAKIGCPYIGKSFRKAFYIYNTDAQERDAAGMPERIEVIQSGLDYWTLRDGQRINTSGLIVKAFLQDGTQYDAGGYDGRIPVTELEIIPKFASLEAVTSYTGEVIGPPTEGLELPAKYGTFSGSDYLEYSSAPGYLLKYHVIAVEGSSTIVCAARRYTNESGDQYHVIFASKSTFKAGSKTTTIDEGPDPSLIDLHDAQFLHSDFYEEPFYCSTISQYAPLVLKYIKLPAIPVVSSEATFGTDYMKALYLALYGETTAVEGRQTISVNWKRPDGVTLTTTFQIKVSEEGGQGGANR